MLGKVQFEVKLRQGQIKTKEVASYVELCLLGLRQEFNVRMSSESG
jgi:hypothetical protein